MNSYILTNCDFCGIELHKDVVCAHCERKFMPKDKSNYRLEGTPEWKDAKMDENFSKSDEYEEMLAGQAQINEDEENRKHGTPDTCIDCGHKGIYEIDFAEPGYCHMCIKR